MVQGINNVCNIFAHITVNIIGLAQKFRGLVGKVGGYHFVDNAVG